jgi:hypothetical protein
MTNMGDENKDSTKDFWKLLRYLGLESETPHLFLSN